MLGLEFHIAVLCVNHNYVKQFVQNQLSCYLSLFCLFQESAEKFCKKPVRRVGRSAMLYVTQREYATVAQGDGKFLLGMKGQVSNILLITVHISSPYFSCNVYMYFE